jgi:hypothetical protein
VKPSFKNDKYLHFKYEHNDNTFKTIKKTTKRTFFLIYYRITTKTTKERKVILTIERRELFNHREN